MRSLRLGQPLASLLLASLASAQQVLHGLSFGEQGSIHHDLPGWEPTSINHEIQYYSDRLILTPPIPGNVKAALWTKETAPASEWTAEFQFRTNGQEGGLGNIQIWYTKDKESVGVNSVYNVGNFDGLALVIDQYGGQGGSIRGFLNDGSTNYKAHHNLESVAFGHCAYSYRNLGRLSTLKVSSHHGLTVSIDDRVCFESDKIVLPPGYFFGVTASTADTPDSFEVTKFEVTSGGHEAAQHTEQHTEQRHEDPDHPSNRPTLQKLDRLPGAPEALPDRDADEIESQHDQFADLHNRLQGMTHQMATMFGELQMMREIQQKQHEATLEKVQNMQGSRETGLPPDTVNTINRLNERVANVERLLQAVQRDLQSNDNRQALARIQSAVERVQGGLSDHLPETVGHLIRASAPRMGMFLFIILGVQALLVGAYVLYKRRRNGMPKKYL